MQKVLFILHQKTSIPGDIGNKFQNRGYKIEICRPPLGDELPSNLINYSAIVVFGASVHPKNKKTVEFLSNPVILTVKFIYIFYFNGVQFPKN